MCKIHEKGGESAAHCEALRAAVDRERGAVGGVLVRLRLAPERRVRQEQALETVAAR